MTRRALSEALVAHRLARVGLFTGAYLGASVWAALRMRNTEFVFYILVMVVLIGCVVWIDRRVGLSAGLLWGLAIWGALHMAGGLVTVPADWPTDGGFRVLYSWWIVPRAGAEGGSGGWLKYDQLTHAYGFGMATWLCWQGLCGALAGSDSGRGGRSGAEEGASGRRPTPGLMVLVAAAGMGLGALNEVVEFIATRITVTNVGGYENTGWDLIFNTLGATVAATWIGLASTPSPSAERGATDR